MVDFLPGDILALYTDGVTEARNSTDETFGLERLEQIVRQAGAQRAHEICQAVTTSVNDFSADIGGPEDDLTISIVKVK